MANDELLRYGPELDDYTNNRLLAGVDDPDDPNQRAAARLRITVRPRPKEIPSLIEAPANVAGGIGNLLRNASNLSADDFRTARNKLFGMDGEERFMTFPERMVRGAVRTAQDAATGDFGTVYPDANGMVSDEAMGARQARDFQGVQDLSNVAIGGSMPMVAAKGRAGGATLGSAPVSKAFENIKPSKDLKAGFYDDYEAVGDKTLPVKDLNSRAVIDASGITRTQKIVDKIGSEKGYWERPLVDEKGNVVEGQHRIDAALQLGVPEVPVTVIRRKDGTLRSGVGDETPPVTMSQVGSQKVRTPTVAEATNYAKRQLEESSGMNWKDYPPEKQQAAIRNAYDYLSTRTNLEPAPVFYSGVENALEHSTLATATPEQWLGTLKNAKGVKPEEMQWLGLEDFLAEKKAKGEKVTRADLQEHIANNKIEVKEVNKEGRAIDDDYLGEKAQEIQDSWNTRTTLTPRNRQDGLTDLIDDAGNVVSVVHPDQAAHTARELQREIRMRIKEGNEDALFDLAMGAADSSARSTGGGTKFSDYQLPGGSDYGELLLTLPGAGTKKLKDNVPEHQARHLKNPDQEVGNYQSSHWDEPNVLAHVRYNTREIDGKKTLHLEEIQSDWHQEGRKKGYKAEKPTDDEILKILRSVDNNYDKLPKDAQQRYFNAARAKLIKDKSGVPDAPFKKSWPELAFKRMLRYAAENGYDAISWTPGEAQAARYDLSKRLDAIEVHKLRDGHFQVSGKKPGSKSFETIIKDTPGDKLADHIGKDLADKISKQTEQVQEYSGLDLKVGGEGMKKFYDDQLAVIANKYGKAHGTKVEKKALSSSESGTHYETAGDGSIYPTDISGTRVDGPVYSVKPVQLSETQTGYQLLKDGKPEGDAFATNNAAKTEMYRLAKEHEAGSELKVHFMPLPKSLHETALQKGFPLFSHGLMLTPVDHDPFKKDKQ